MINACHFCDDDKCPVGYGKCHCGCGEETKISQVTRKDRNQVKGRPLKILKNHRSRVFVHTTSADGCLYCEGECSVGYGFCHCGCGSETNLATYGSRWHHHQRGKPVRFVVGHARRKPVVLIDGIRHKQCAGCELSKPLGDFGFNLSGAQGRAARCLLCAASASIKRYKAKSNDPVELRKRRMWAIRSFGYPTTIEEVERVEIEQNGLLCDMQRSRNHESIREGPTNCQLIIVMN